MQPQRLLRSARRYQRLLVQSEDAQQSSLYAAVIASAVFTSACLTSTLCCRPCCCSCI